MLLVKRPIPGNKSDVEQFHSIQTTFLTPLSLQTFSSHYCHQAILCQREGQIEQKQERLSKNFPVIELRGVLTQSGEQAPHQRSATTTLPHQINRSRLSPFEWALLTERRSIDLQMIGWPWTDTRLSFIHKTKSSEKQISTNERSLMIRTTNSSPPATRHFIGHIDKFRRWRDVCRSLFRRHLD